MAETGSSIHSLSSPEVVHSYTLKGAPSSGFFFVPASEILVGWVTANSSVEASEKALKYGGDARWEEPGFCLTTKPSDRDRSGNALQLC